MWTIILLRFWYIKRFESLIIRELPLNPKPKPSNLITPNLKTHNQETNPKIENNGSHGYSSQTLEVQSKTLVLLNHKTQMHAKAVNSNIT
jgi:hypothetical protein